MNIMKKNPKNPPKHSTLFLLEHELNQKIIDPDQIISQKVSFWWHHSDSFPQVWS